MLMKINSNGEVMVSSSFSVLEDGSLVSVSLHNFKHVLSSGEVACEKGFFIPYDFLSVEWAETPEEIMFLENVAREFTEYMCPIFVEQDAGVMHSKAHTVKPFYILPGEILEHETLARVMRHMSFQEYASRVMFCDIAKDIVESSDNARVRTLSQISKNNLLTLETGDDRFLSREYFEEMASTYVAG